MSDVRDLHDKAMELAQLAVVARHRGEQDRAEDLARRAYEYESQAADLVPEDRASEPTRSILYRSAASLAYQCREFQAAQRFIMKGLSGYPPPEIEQELKNLYEQMNFEYHLQRSGAVLEDEDLELSLQGNAVSFGVVLYDEFSRIIDRTVKLIIRTSQRMMGRTYQRSGRFADEYKAFVPALAGLKEGSFIVTLKLVRPEVHQMPLWGDAAGIIDEIMTGIEFLNNSNEEGLKQLIQPEEGYYQNFVSLTRDMAPDGDKISFVGLTSKSRSISLTRHRSDIEIVPKIEASEDDVERKPIKVGGRLDYATSRRQDVIGLTTDENDEYNLLVEEGMDDLVRSYYGQRVVITGIQVGKNVYLTDIQAGD